MSKEAYYFSHDGNARNDPKILALRGDFGLVGYGLYWIVIETLREQDEYKLPLKKYVFSAIGSQIDANALQMHANAEQKNAKDFAEEFIRMCIDEYDLFASDGEYFWSNSLLKRMQKKAEISKKRSAAAKKRHENASNTNDSGQSEEPDTMQKDANAMQMHANAMQNDASKGKESKVKEIKDNNKLVPKFTFDDMENAQLLFELMQANNPDVKKPNFHKWADEFRLIRERDERTDKQIKYLIRWTQHDTFWKSNILSPSKLRKQWDQLAIKAKDDYEKKQQVQIGTGPTKGVNWEALAGE